MNYIMIIFAAFLFSLQFLFNNGYQKENGGSWSSSLVFSLYTSLGGLILLLVINKLQLRITAFSAAAAVVYALVNVSLSYCSIRAFEYANLSVYSVFSMIGGMLLPFAYGIFCGEELTAVRLVCCVLIAASVAVSVHKNEQSKKANKYYIAVFALNGLVGVISKFHQSYANLCVDSASFMMLTKLATILLSLILMLKARTFAIGGRAFAYCAGYAVFNSIGNLLVLIALLGLPASVQYPIVTGGVIVFSTVIDILRRSKVTKKEIAAAAIAFASAALMAL